MEELFNPLPELETERVRLRKLTYDDAQDIFNYASQRQVSDQVTWEAHQSIEETLQFIDFAHSRYDQHTVAPWGIEHKQDQKIIGTADFVWWKPEHRVAEIGYVLSPDYWGQGIIPEVVNEMIRFGFEEMNLVRIQALCLEDNQKSERIMQKVGMTYEGTMVKRFFVKGKHRNLKMYAITK